VLDEFGISETFAVSATNEFDIWTGFDVFDESVIFDIYAPSGFIITTETTTSSVFAE
jgi:hypothetical protein